MFCGKLDTNNNIFLILCPIPSGIMCVEDKHKPTRGLNYYYSV